jgi:hypothetical protein
MLVETVEGGMQSPIAGRRGSKEEDDKICRMMWDGPAPEPEKRGLGDIHACCVVAWTLVI